MAGGDGGHSNEPPKKATSAKASAAAQTAQTPQPRARSHTPPDAPHAEPGAQESISMLNLIVEQAIDDGYAEAAKNPEPPPTGVRRRLRRAGLFLTVLVLGTLLVVAFLQARASEPEVEREKQELTARIDSRTQRLDTLQEQNKQLQQRVDRLQQRALANSRTGKRIQDNIDDLQAHTGVVPVEGPGVKITVDDAPDDAVEDSEEGSSGRILDVDLQHIVNGLWVAGAEAISINGQRLTALTAIRGANEAITVDYRPLARPYVVQAIGDPDTLQARFTESSGGEWVSSLQSVENVRYEIATIDDLRLPADSAAQLRYVR